jgi:polyferredoxin
VDVLRWPVVGRLLSWRHARLAAQVPLFALAVVLVLHGLYGPDLAPKNLATLVTWVHYRGFLVLALLAAGNLFCFACPFLLPRELARRVFRPVWNWPRPLRNKWLAVGLFVAVLFAYELFGLWSAPWWTAWLIVGYFTAALAVDALFKHASFCKWVCPIGQFNFLASAVSPLEVRVRDAGVCSDCRTKDCIRGTPAAPVEEGGRVSLPVLERRGCELALFQPMKVGNQDCTFCLDCVHACPHDNVGVVGRMPGAELFAEGPRSGVGTLHERRDIAALVLVFTFGALLNAFGMVSPVYALQAWMSRVLGTTERAPILAILFVAVLVVEPVVLLGLAAWATRRLTGTRRGVLAVATRYAFSLVPLGFGVWLAHYAFHFLTGILTVVPVAQNALAELGWPVLGTPLWRLTGLRPGAVYPMELGFLGLGLIGSWIVAVRLAWQDHPRSPWRAYLPWLVLHALLFAAGVWLMGQPMEMRGTFLGA